MCDYLHQHPPYIRSWMDKEAIIEQRVHNHYNLVLGLQHEIASMSVGIEQQDQCE